MVLRERTIRISPCFPERGGTVINHITPTRKAALVCDGISHIIPVEFSKYIQQHLCTKYACAQVPLAAVNCLQQDLKYRIPLHCRSQPVPQGKCLCCLCSN